MQKTKMTVVQIIKKYLEENGYDGLCGEECGCGLNDLMPCAGTESIVDCEPAFKRICPGVADCPDGENCISGGDVGTACFTSANKVYDSAVELKEK